MSYTIFNLQTCQTSRLSDRIAETTRDIKQTLKLVLLDLNKMVYAFRFIQYQKTEFFFSRKAFSEIMQICSQKGLALNLLWKIILGQ